MIKLINHFKLFCNKLVNGLLSIVSLFKMKLNVKSILEKNYKKGKTFIFVQIGANDGISFDFLYYFIIERDSKGIVVEPIKEYFNELEINYQNYQNIIKVNKAIHPYEKSMNIYKINNDAKYKYPDWVKGIASFNPSHHVKLNIDSQDIVSEKVECVNLMEIISIKELDYFQIDTEGFDFEILKMIDFNIIKPKVIKYEHSSLSKIDKDSAWKLLQKNGYYLFTEINDTIALDINKIKL